MKEKGLGGASANHYSSTGSERGLSTVGRRDNDRVCRSLPRAQCRRRRGAYPLVLLVRDRCTFGRLRARLSGPFLSISHGAAGPVFETRVANVECSQDAVKFVVFLPRKLQARF